MDHGDTPDDMVTQGHVDTSQDHHEEHGMPHEDENKQPKPDHKWHVDRRVPLIFVFAIVVQTVVVLFGGSWWASAMSTRMSNVETEIKSLTPESSQIIRLQVQMEAVQSTTQRIENMLESRSDVFLPPDQGSGGHH